MGPMHSPAQQTSYHSIYRIRCVSPLTGEQRLHPATRGLQDQWIFVMDPPPPLPCSALPHGPRASAVCATKQRQALRVLPLTILAKAARPAFHTPVFIYSIYTTHINSIYILPTVALARMTSPPHRVAQPVFFFSQSSLITKGPYRVLFSTVLFLPDTL